MAARGAPDDAVAGRRGRFDEIVVHILVDDRPLADSAR